MNTQRDLVPAVTTIDLADLTAVTGGGFLRAAFGIGEPREGSMAWNNRRDFQVYNNIKL